MATTPGRRSITARVVPSLTLVGVAAACLFFAASATPTEEGATAAAAQTSFLTAPALFTAAFAVLAAVILVAVRSADAIFRAGGLLGMMASIGAALGGFLNLVGYANSDIWWAANPDAIRQAAAVLLLTAVVALAVVASEQLWPGWRRTPA
jgi:preprotein translocase subunit SecE